MESGISRLNILLYLSVFSFFVSDVKL
ncbi:hypothetical protein METHP14_390026 [Pseudomonas sp. P14-2025]